MARKRMIDPEFWSDEGIGKWSHTTRLFYIGLWNFSDDNGRFKANSNLLKSQIFPYDDPQTIKIALFKREIGDKIVWYEVEGSQYGYLRNFNKHQRIDRPQASKLPPPPDEKFDELSTNNRRAVLPNIREENIKEENIKEGGSALALKGQASPITKSLKDVSMETLLQIKGDKSSREFKKELIKTWGYPKAEVEALAI
jgi:hypothetical protein